MSKILLELDLNPSDLRDLLRSADLPDTESNLELLAQDLENNKTWYEDLLYEQMVSVFANIAPIGQ